MGNTVWQMRLPPDPPHLSPQHALSSSLQMPYQTPPIPTANTPPPAMPRCPGGMHPRLPAVRAGGLVVCVIVASEGPSSDKMLGGAHRISHLDLILFQ